MQTSTWRAVILLLLAALCGGAVGSAVTARVIGHRLERPEGPGHGTEWYVAMLTRELSLSGTQQDSVRAVLRRRRAPMDSVMAALRPGMDRMRDSIRGDIRTLLTPTQQARFAEVTARLDAHRRNQMKRDSTDR
ncbi:MAG TPA: hypothetical protein VH879_00975 [Gemmatimonadales bacterium]|jgi:hypothetical protein